jgi:sugar lactone lactonase YvrE
MQLRDAKSTTSPRAAVVVISIFLLAAFASWAGCGTSTHTTPHATRSLVVPDSGNNRVLIYNSPFGTDESASVVLGQSQFTTNGTGLTAATMNSPTDTAEDSAGNVYVNDAGNNRVLQFKPPFTNGMSASVAIGQPDFVTGNTNTTQNGLNYAFGSAFDSGGNLWVVDFGNSRILQYQPPFATNMNASLVIGQPNFTSGGTATTNSGLSFPYLVAFDASGDLWVTDGGNNRVLEFKPPFANGMAASLVIGQTDFVSGGAATTASGLSLPCGVAFDSAGDLWIGDIYNSRVLEFKPPFANGMSASLVLGQASFTAGGASGGQSGFYWPFGIAFDSSGNLYVADYGNNRTLEFAPPFSNNQNASLVLGQTNFTSYGPATTATGQSNPVAVTAAF